VNVGKEAALELRWPTWIGVVADDLERQRQFYRETLGLREAEHSAGWVHFEIPGGGMFELIQRDALPQYDEKRYQVGFTVADIHAAHAELIRRGAAPLTEIEPTEPGSHNLWCYFRDSEGNVFEITQWLEPAES
jgi:catechol 2,3-dioxygenase-like lactoylglutathione lyase family enzyme